MFDMYNTLKYAELRYKERLEEAEQLLRYQSLPTESLTPLLPRVRAKLDTFAQRLSASVSIEEPCPDIPCEQPAH